MMTPADPSAQALDAGVVIGGAEVGRVGRVYTDNETGQPSWVTVKTGWFGTSESVVPLSAESIDGDTIRVPYDKDMIKGAPHAGAGEPLSETDEQELYGYQAVGPATGPVGLHDAEPPQYAASVGSEYLTRSEEQLHVGIEKVQTGRCPAPQGRRHRTADNHRPGHPGRGPTGSGTRRSRGPFETTIGQATTDVVLTEEHVVVSKETVPVEKVRSAPKPSLSSRKSPRPSAKNTSNSMTARLPPVTNEPAPLPVR